MLEAGRFDSVSELVASELVVTGTAAVAFPLLVTPVGRVELVNVKEGEAGELLLG